MTRQSPVARSELRARDAQPATRNPEADLVERFESCTVAEFHHADHVRVAWAMLREMPLPDALVRFTESLRRFAAAGGKPELYDETLTRTYIIVIHQRMQRAPAAEWNDFAHANGDLLTWPPPAGLLPQSPS